jgi:dTDP-4-dehydrorhamnose 3,5-epimerase
LIRQVPTSLEGLVLLEPEVHADRRGFFVETFRAQDWKDAGVEAEFVQENQSRSTEGTLRGLHFQLDPPQAKLLRCSLGKVWDVVVDLRKESATFGQWEAFELDDERHRQLFVPVGFAHGFCVLSEVADVVYKVSGYYNPKGELGIAWDDPEIGVEWPLSSPLLSERDTSLPSLSEALPSIPF